MKEYKFVLDELAVKDFFTVVRQKIDIIEILMKSINYMSDYDEAKEKTQTGLMVLRIDKTKRLLYFTEDKYFSISFPFSVMKVDEELKFYTNQKINVDYLLTSQVLNIINCDEFNEQCSLDFVEPIYACEENFNKDFWLFLRELLMSEDGYIRYDYDEINYNKYKEKGEELKHPLNHYDIFYTNYSTFKIGLNQKIDENYFQDFVDVSSNCKFLVE
ncbi:hypothetical protein ALC152_14580 [Arcobacter sp. 15-2]|uniref:hypothetical protein n=1 Tax=Arcobacter sp. 15-2 TaxID=3374109 RepID=UPI00399C8412